MLTFFLKANLNLYKSGQGQLLESKIYYDQLHVHLMKYCCFCFVKRRTDKAIRCVLTQNDIEIFAALILCVDLSHMKILGMSCGKIVMKMQDS